MRTTITSLAVAALSALALVAPASAATVPVASWEMNETSGSVMVDSSANRIHGTVGSLVAKNGVYYTFPAAPDVPDDRRLGLAKDDPRLDPGTGNFAVTVHFKTKVGSPNIVQKGQAAVAGGYWKIVLNAGYPRCEFRDGTGRTLTADLVGTSATNLSHDGYWHVVRCELTATGARVTLDPGTSLEATAVKTGTHARIDNNRPVSVGGKARCNGATVGCDYFTGSIDYVRITRF